MAQSPEYPDLPWVPSRWWSEANRKSVQLIVIHTTEGHEKASSAEDGAAYDARRDEKVSTQYFHDQNSTVQCVRTEDHAFHARKQGNRRGIGHELCGKAGQGAAGWADAASQGTLRQAARQCARDARKWKIPVRHLTVAQVAAGEKGFCGHRDITRAFPQDGGDHTDPGPTFPWDEFLDMVRAELDGDDMPEPKDLWDYKPDGNQTAGGYLVTEGARSKELREVLLPAMSASIAQLAATLRDFTGRDFVDEAAVVGGVLAGLTPEVFAAAMQAAGLSPHALAALIPAAIRREVADELRDRLES